MLQKQGIDIPFAKGLDTKTDPKRVPIGNFRRLENTVFEKGGLLQKRNGFGKVSSLPDSSYSYLTTLNNNLTAIGTSIAAYNATNSTWVQKGSLQPVDLSTLPVVRNNFNMQAVDSAVAPNGALCTVYLESNGSTVTNKYVVTDAITGQNIVAPTAVPATTGAVTGGMRVFVLGNQFIIMFTQVISAVSHLQYIAVSIYNPTIVTANADIATAYLSNTNLSFDACVVGSRLYIAYQTAANVIMIYLTTTLVFGPSVTFTAATANRISVTADVTFPTNPTIYISMSTAPFLIMWAVDQSLNLLLTNRLLSNAATGPNVTSAAQNGTLYTYMEITNAYGYDVAIPTNYVMCWESVGGTVTASYVVIRSVGLASKAFIDNGVVYFLSAYQSSYQPTYFLINATKSRQAAPVITLKIAYENGGGYLTKGLPNITVYGGQYFIGYLFKDLIQAVNKNTNVPAGSQTAGIYSQLGINVVRFLIGTTGLDTAEIGNDLHISGGFLWMYDGYLPVEHNFFLFPDNVELTTSTTGGLMTAQQYFYQVTYEWTDNQGNAYRSAPSIPVSITTTGTTSTVTVNIPTLRVTMKTANPVKIVIYRWSTAQQSYYQVTSIITPVQNSTTSDAIAFVDTLADASILGNNLIYTTGGVIEDVNAPASNILTLFDDRLWLVNAEDQNLLWFSKQVIEATPVEMSDLLTIYVAPTTGSEVSTGPITALSVMDDKLIIVKQNAFYYINGTGPDNTGANNQYSPPTFITSTIGCTNQKSIVFQPMGLMFQSDKGIWLLERGLGTSYIGAPVEDFTKGALVLSAVNIPETNQVRFTLDTGLTLMFDYYFQQWAVFKGIPGLSSCIFQQQHTYIDKLGQVFQETPGAYLDNTSPVLMAFTTGPIRLGDLQNYQRAYFFYVLGSYVSPHKLVMSMSYDYEDQPTQSVVIQPGNYSPAFGAGESQSPFGQQSAFGGPAALENWRVFLTRQRCMAFAITMEEIFDPQFGSIAGAGLTLSGLNVVCAFKQKFRPQPAATSIG